MERREAVFGGDELLFWRLISELRYKKKKSAEDFIRLNKCKIHDNPGGPTSQKNSFPLRPQNQEIQDTSSELLILLTDLETVSAPPRFSVNKHRLYKRGELYTHKQTI